MDFIASICKRGIALPKQSKSIANHHDSLQIPSIMLGFVMMWPNQEMYPSCSEVRNSLGKRCKVLLGAMTSAVREPLLLLRIPLPNLREGHPKETQLFWPSPINSRFSILNSLYNTKYTGERDIFTISTANLKSIKPLEWHPLLARYASPPSSGSPF